MNLAFSEVINGKPSFFVQKIWASIIKSVDKIDLDLFVKLSNDYGKLTKNRNDYQRHLPKIHTIRHDPKGRWKIGDKIHFIINPRAKNRFQFAPILDVKAVQKIEIFHDILKIGKPYIQIDKTVLISQNDILQFAQNDGFDCVEDFFAYFSKDFTGVIIHWTDKKY